MSTLGEEADNDSKYICPDLGEGGGEMFLCSPPPLRHYKGPGSERLPEKLDKMYGI